LKVIVEEQEVASSSPAVPRVEKRVAVANVAVHAQPQARATENAKLDTYPSCLDLAAEFIARG
jgi:hypothetical protein